MGLARLKLIAGFFVFALCVLFITQSFLPTNYQRGKPATVPRPSNPRPIEAQEPPPANVDVQCRGPRGRILTDPSTEDLLKPVYNLPNVSFPEPTFGSWDVIELEKAWMTFKQRYGPYGYGEDNDSYDFTRVNWNTVDWGNLQDQCMLARPKRFHGSEFLQAAATPRFRLDGDGDVQESVQEKTGRQAVILRTWDSYEYTEEDLWSLRAIISETSLATNGRHTVFLLVDVKREDGAKIHEDDEFYQQVLKESVPEEFWNIAVLFHRSLQSSWYPKVDEFRPMWQIMQPLQLFAHFYPFFDHYWQFEMDTRFTGDVGKMLKAFHRFGTREPLKQSRERSSWTYMPKIHGSWEDFSAGVNESLQGGATVWGAVNNGVETFQAVGPQPPTSDPKDDEFEWGVDEDADLLTFSPVFDVLRFETHEDWVFKDWVGGGINRDTPRFLAAPAQARASRKLLEAIHKAQHEDGLKVPAEATLPTFALWHGLQVVQVPMPKLQYPERNLRELNFIYNGGMSNAFSDGIANGFGPYKKHYVEFYERPRTWEWQSSLTDPAFERWMQAPSEHHDSLSRREAASLGAIPDGLPSFLAEVDGKVYAPNFMLHPRKTNR